MILDETFEAYMKGGYIEEVPSCLAFRAGPYEFHIITDGVEYGVAEKSSGCLVCGPYPDPETANSAGQDLIRQRSRLEIERNIYRLRTEAIHETSGY